MFFVKFLLPLTDPHLHVCFRGTGQKIDTNQSLHTITLVWAFQYFVVLVYYNLLQVWVIFSYIPFCMGAWSVVSLAGRALWSLANRNGSGPMCSPSSSTKIAAAENVSKVIVGHSLAESFESLRTVAAACGRHCRVTVWLARVLAWTDYRRAAPRSGLPFLSASSSLLRSGETSVSCGPLKAVMVCFANRSAKSSHLLVLLFSLKSMLSTSTLPSTILTFGTGPAAAPR